MIFFADAGLIMLAVLALAWPLSALALALIEVAGLLALLQRRASHA